MATINWCEPTGNLSLFTTSQFETNAHVHSEHKYNRIKCVCMETYHFREENIDGSRCRFPNGGPSGDGSVAVTGEDAHRPDVERR